MDRDRYVHLRLDLLVDAGDIERLFTGDAQRYDAIAALELARQHAHADQVRAVDALETLGNHGLDAQKLRALRRPVAGRSGAVFLATEDDGRRPLRDVLHRRVIDRHLLVAGLEQRDAPLDAGSVGLP